MATSPRDLADALVAPCCTSEGWKKALAEASSASRPESGNRRSLYLPNMYSLPDSRYGLGE